MAGDMFLKLDGIDGESQDEVHQNEMEVMSWGWGATNAGAFQAGTGGGTGKASFQDISITKTIDKASPILFKACATGQHIDSGTITVRKAGGDQLEYLVIQLTNVLVSSYSQSGSTGHDLPIDHFTLNMEQFQVTYKQQAASGGGDASVDFGYNISQHKTT